MDRSRRACDSYEDLCHRIDAFISDHLEQGDFACSLLTTEAIYLALYRAFPGEGDLFPTFAERLARLNIETREDVATGVDIIVGIRVRPPIPATATGRVHLVS